MPSQDQSRVVVTDIRMPFWSIVIFMVKFSIASIPAFLILLAVGFIVAVVFGGLVGGLGGLAEPQ